MISKKLRFSYLSAALLTSLVISYPHVNLAYANDSNNNIKGTISVEGQKKASYPKLAKIQMKDAINSAKSVAQGSVLGAELESKSGFLVYEVKIISPDNAEKEVYVDAGSGKVLKVKNENAESGSA